VTAVADLFARRAEPIAALAEIAGGIAGTAHAMAGQFARGGTLFTFGTGAAAADALHVAVEFIHPVLVGKRALPARWLPTADALHVLAGPDDMALAIGADVAGAMQVARDLGLLTVALVGVGDAGDAVDHRIVVPSDDPLIVREGHVTAYHLLWELVHVFLELERPS
jgi:D-sedoheptulose 7-phosphate isomerase